MSKDPLADSDYAKYGFKDPEEFVFKSEKGLNEKLIKLISSMKDEPEWLEKMRLKAYNLYLKKALPTWGGDLSKINFDEIHFYGKPTENKADSWDDVPDTIKNTFDKLGIPEAEQKYFGGVGAQYESETVYHNLRKELVDQGIVFLDTDTAVKEYPEVFRKWFTKIVPPHDNKFAALNTAVWSGGSFVYIPEGVSVEFPLQAYFRINAKNIGQFERTLIIAEPGSSVHYIEGCTAPVYSSQSLHAAVVEVVALKGAKIRYTTVQNWSNDVYNLVTKRAHAYENARVEWVDGNLGSTVTMKYPSVYCMGNNSSADILSIAYAGKNQHQDAGAKVVHFGKNSSSRIVNKSVSKYGGRTTYRGLVKVVKGATGVKSQVECDALMLDDISRTDTYPVIQIDEEDTLLSHEARVGKIGDDEIFYFQSRGIPEGQASHMLVMGFLEPFAKELPLDYAIELHRLIELEMEGSIG
ncbi:MAG: Fe-S cluster assembly protein SufB [Candidatus Hodarchaeales archaeon]|jgi:Fe-S cluster assembly protein SufB